jgi:IS1 family transposase
MCSFDQEQAEAHEHIDYRLYIILLSKKQVQLHQEAEIKEVKEAGVQVDGIRVKQAGKITWAAVAIAMSSFLILGLSVGKRAQGLVDLLIAEVWGRCQSIGIFLSDGWSCYFSALQRCYARLYRSRSKQRGRKMAKRLKFDRLSPFYGQVIKQTKDKFRLCAVRCKALIGTMSECLFFIKTYELGNKIHTSHIERWFGTLRCHIASLRRKSRCFGKSEAILSERMWIFIWFHNWTLIHDSLTIKGIKRTPAMAAGLAEHPLTYRDRIHLRIKENLQLKERIQTKLKEMQSKEVMGAAKRTKRPKDQESVIWKAPPQEKQREAA